MRRHEENSRTPYGLDLTALETLSPSVSEDFAQRVRHQLAAIAELAAIMPPPVPLRGLGPSYDAYSLRVDQFTIFYAVDPIGRMIVLRNVSPRLAPTPA